STRSKKNAIAISTVAGALIPLQTKAGVGKKIVSKRPCTPECLPHSNMTIASGNCTIGSIQDSLACMNPLFPAINLTPSNQHSSLLTLCSSLCDLCVTVPPAFLFSATLSELGASALSSSPKLLNSQLSTLQPLLLSLPDR